MHKGPFPTSIFNLSKILVSPAIASTVRSLCSHSKRVWSCWPLKRGVLVRGGEVLTWKKQNANPEVQDLIMGLSGGWVADLPVRWKTVQTTAFLSNLASSITAILPAGLLYILSHGLYPPILANMESNKSPGDPWEVPLEISNMEYWSISYILDHHKA